MIEFELAGTLVGMLGFDEFVLDTICIGGGGAQRFRISGSADGVVEVGLGDSWIGDTGGFGPSGGERDGTERD